MHGIVHNALVHMHVRIEIDSCTCMDSASIVQPAQRRLPAVQTRNLLKYQQVPASKNNSCRRLKTVVYWMVKLRDGQSSPQGDDHG
ncbi:hypothetical protein UFOVP1196_31 [uncultured Caudovirales phage]|uniref:Uncharacterized protein n=1 Tax=uncultured Caudovirales phage TaxID=2100421 RepID=A0A6J5QZH1_9CAUD|nr:hypothetical protein UFOVP1196_31 [uncultured Caudovirales phage]